MKRFLLSIIFCSPLLLSAPSSFSITLIGPNGERPLSTEQYGPISNVETLWAVASKLRPNKSVSVLQTLAAIYKLNPNAFADGNINQILPQSIIMIPSLEMISAQTNREASRLLNKYSVKRSSPTVIKKSIAPIVVIKEEKIKIVKNTLPIQAPIKPQIQPLPIKKEIVKPLVQNTAKSAEALALIESLQTELEIINEEFLLSEEANQRLKLKLQPMYDQMNTLIEQIETDKILVQEKQDKINDLEEQLAAKVESAFSGDGILNEILRFITSSLAHLLMVIISPVLLLLAGLVLMMRLRNKKELAQEEQELAESTATLMETSEGLFDELLTDDDDDAEDNIELDFTKDAKINEDNSTEENNKDVALSDSSETDVDVVDLSADDEVEEPKQETSEVKVEEDLIDEIDFDGSEVETSEDDPFGIGALVDLEEEEPISAADQANLDLAAEWEAQISEDPAPTDSLIDDIFGDDVKKSEGSELGNSALKEADESLEQTAAN